VSTSERKARSPESSGGTTGAANLPEEDRVSPGGRENLPARVLVVDDETTVRQILVRKLTSLGYSCDTRDNGWAALDALRAQNYDLLLADIVMPEMSGVALMKDALRLCPDLAVILVTSVVEVKVAVDAVKQGAFDYISKPFSLEEVSVAVARALEKRRLLIENREYQKNLEHLVVQRTRQVKQALDLLQHTYQATLLALGTALDSREADSSGHSLRAARYATRIARRMKLSERQLLEIEQGALLHDIGKIGVPDALLRKPGRLSESEWVLMRRHPEIGFRILSRIKSLEGAARLVLHHHEKYDGTGYPGRLKNGEISLGARVFSIADALDCITSVRPFQAAASFEAAVDEIRRVSGSQLDPEIVNAFLQVPVNEWREMSHQVAAELRRDKPMAHA